MRSLLTTVVAGALLFGVSVDDGYQFATSLAWSGAPGVYKVRTRFMASFFAVFARAPGRTSDLTLSSCMHA